jgi:hypothetical protein
MKITPSFSFKRSKIVSSHFPFSPCSPLRDQEF